MIDREEILRALPMGETVQTYGTFKSDGPVPNISCIKVKDLFGFMVVMDCLGKTHAVSYAEIYHQSIDVLQALIGDD